MANIPMKNIQFPGLDDTYTFAQVDNTLTTQGAAADAKKTGDEITELKNDLSEAVTDLKSALSDTNNSIGKTITIINRFDKTKAETGRISSSGTVDTTVTNEFTSDYIDVSDVNGIVIGRYVNNAWATTNCYYVLYDASKTMVGSRTTGSSINTTNASYIRFSGSQSYIGNFMLVASDYTPTQYIPYSRSVSFSYVDNAIESIDDYVNENALLSLIHQSKVTYGAYYQHNSNNTSSSTNSAIMPAIKIVEGLTYYYKDLYAYFCNILYDGESSCTAFSNSSTPSMQSGHFVAEHNGVVYLTLSVSSGTINGTPTFTNYETSGDSTVEIYPSSDVIQLLKDNVGKKIHFNSGVYDIISIYESKYGADFFENYSGYSGQTDLFTRGLNIGRGTEICFSKGALFTAEYSGNNANVSSDFAAFAIESGVVLDGLILEVSGLRNCIHDDFDNANEGTTIIKNCSLKGNSNVIAGGLGFHETVVIENCCIEYTGTARNYDFSYHNNGSDNAQSLVIIKDNYLAKGCSIRWYGPSTRMTDVLVTNNSMAYDVNFQAENASAVVQNIALKKWNNEIRS